MLPFPRTWPCAHSKGPSQDFALYPTIEVTSNVPMQPTEKSERWQSPFLLFFFRLYQLCLSPACAGGCMGEHWGALVQGYGGHCRALGLSKAVGSGLDHEGLKGAMCAPPPARLG